MWRLRGSFKIKSKYANQQPEIKDSQRHGALVQVKGSRRAQLALGQVQLLAVTLPHLGKGEAEI